MWLPVGETMIEDWQRLTAASHQGVVEFSPQRVVYRSNRGFVTVTGQGLALSAMDREALTIEGQIQTICRSAAQPPAAGKEAAYEQS